MAAYMTIGDFSRATRLSAKALRFYHRVGLLEPAVIDPVNHYRLYESAQIPEARTVQRLRSLDMPVDEIRRILGSTDPAAGAQAIAHHLHRMEERLSETRDAVAALREMLTEPETPLEIRRVPALDVVIIRDSIELPQLGDWFTSARRDLRAGLEAAGVDAVGPLGGLFSTELFLHEAGDCALFLPVESAPRAVFGGRAAFETLPATRMAVAVHQGSDHTISRAYAALGAHVAGRGDSAAGPIRETYTGDAPSGVGTTEIGWPLTDAAAT